MLSILALKILNRYTSVYRKIELVFIKQQDSLNSTKPLSKKHSYWNFVSYLCFGVLVLVIYQSVYFGNEINSPEGQLNQRGIVAWLFTILVDLTLSRFVYCLLFVVVKLISKSEKEKLINDAKEILFYRHLIRKKVHCAKPAESIEDEKLDEEAHNTHGNLIDGRIKQGTEVDRRTIFQNASSALQRPESKNDEPDFEHIEAESGVKNKRLPAQQDSLNFARHKNYLQQSSGTIANRILTQSIGQTIKLSTSEIQKTKPIRSNTSQLNESNRTIEQEIGPQAVNIEVLYRSNMRFKDMKANEDNSILLNLQELREICAREQNAALSVQNRDMSIFRRQESFNIENEFQLSRKTSENLAMNQIGNLVRNAVVKKGGGSGNNQSLMINESEFVEFFPEDQTSKKEYLGLGMKDGEIMKTVTEEREETNAHKGDSENP